MKHFKELFRGTKKISSERSAALLAFCKPLGLKFRDLELLDLAFHHRSFSNESRQYKRFNNERLEYLGDAVLGAVIAEFLYKKYPLRGEGFLTEMRSKIVSRKSLGSLAHRIGLTELIEHQPGTEGGFKSMGGDAMEALIGAIYIEKGYRFTRKLIIKRLLCTYIDVDTVAQTDWNYKSKIIDWGQKNHRKVTFETVRSIMRNNSGRREYECRVNIDGEPKQSAIEYTIKAAEQLAAEKTYKALQEAGEVSPVPEI